MSSATGKCATPPQGESFANALHCATNSSTDAARNFSTDGSEAASSGSAPLVGADDAQLPPDENCSAKQPVSADGAPKRVPSAKDATSQMLPEKALRVVDSTHPAKDSGLKSTAGKVAAKVEERRSARSKGAVTNDAAAGSPDGPIQTVAISTDLAVISPVRAMPAQPDAKAASGVHAAKKAPVMSAAAGTEVSPNLAAVAVPMAGDARPEAAIEDAEVETVRVSGDSVFAGKNLAATSAHAPSDEEDGTAGVSFSYSMHGVTQMHAVPGGRSEASADAPRAPVPEAEAPQSYAPAVRRLEVQVNDPALGNVDVRAEMRGGALHASIAAGGPIANTMPELHHFLQQHQVTVHSLSYIASEAVRAVGDAADSTYNQSMSRSDGGEQASQQHQQPKDRKSEWQRSLARDDSGRGNRSMYTQMPAAVAASLTPGRTLSIHI